MKQRSIITALFLALLALSSCQDTEQLPEASTNALVIAPTVKDVTEVKSVDPGNEFFAKDDQVDVTVAGKKYAYSYADGVFSSTKPYYFLLGDSPIDINIKWPAGRPVEIIDKDKKLTIPTDQRELADFKKADWLTVVSSQISGIMSTETPVPLEFTHDNVLLEFEVAGQNAYGQGITEMLLALTLTPTLQNKGEKLDVAFWGYCGVDSIRAKIILPPGVSIDTESPGSSPMIGRITVADSTKYTGSILLPSSTKVDLLAGYRYLVTLTPVGDNLVASIKIGGFGQDEEGVGYPFQTPTPIPAGNYLIGNKAQLNTLSYLVRQYTTDGFNTIDWKNETFQLADFTIDEAFATQWRRMPKGGMTIRDHQGNEITSIAYGDNKILELYAK